MTRLLPEGMMRAGTRGSVLALTQTRSVIAALKKKFPRLEFQTVLIKTTGDKIQDVRASLTGSRGLFTKEIEEALLEGEIDFAVHSLKDLPTEIPDGLHIGAILKRVDPGDCLVSLKGWTLKTLPAGARVGTSSPRRQSQIRRMRPDVKVQEMRGNLDTRIHKLESGEADAIVVAWAGIHRLGGTSAFKKIRISRIPYAQMLPAVGQGTLAIEIRKGDRRTGSVVRALHDKNAFLRAMTERAFLRTLQGGCQIPVGGLAEIRGGKIRLEGEITSLSGKKFFRGAISAAGVSPEKIGVRLAEKLLKAGGRAILEEIRR